MKEKNKKKEQAEVKGNITDKAEITGENIEQAGI